MPPYVNPNFQNPSPSPPQPTINRRTTINNWLNNHSSLLSIVIALFLGFISFRLSKTANSLAAQSIDLTKKYGENEDQIKTLREISTEQQKLNTRFANFMEQQIITNQKLYSLDSIEQEEFIQLKGLTSVVAWDPINKLMSDREDFFIELSLIQSDLRPLLDTTKKFSSIELRTRLRQITECIFRLENSQIIRVEHWKQLWSNLMSSFNYANNSLKEIDSIALTPGFIKYKALNRNLGDEFLIRFFTVPNDTFKLLLALKSFPMTDSYINKLLKIKILSLGKDDPNHPY